MRAILVYDEEDGILEIRAISTNLRENLVPYTKDICDPPPNISTIKVSRVLRSKAYKLMNIGALDENLLGLDALPESFSEAILKGIFDRGITIPTRATVKGGIQRSYVLEFKYSVSKRKIQIRRGRSSSDLNNKKYFTLNFECRNGAIMVNGVLIFRIFPAVGGRLA